MHVCVTIDFVHFSVDGSMRYVVSPDLFEAARSGDFSLVTLEKGDNMDVKVSCVCVCTFACLCVDIV